MRDIKLGIEGSGGCLGMCTGGETIPDKTCTIKAALEVEVEAAMNDETAVPALMWVDVALPPPALRLVVSYRAGRTLVHTAVPGIEGIRTASSVLLPDRPAYDRAHRCATKLLPALRFLARDLASRPEFLDEEQSALLLGPLLEERELVVCRALGGLLLVAKDGRRGGLRRSLLHINCEEGRMELCDASDVVESGGCTLLRAGASSARPVASLPDAIAAFVAQAGGRPGPALPPAPSTPEKSNMSRKSTLPAVDPAESTDSSTSSPEPDATSPSFTGGRSEWRRPSPSPRDGPEDLTAKEVVSLLSGARGGAPSWPACVRAVRALDAKRAELAAAPMLGSQGGAMWGSEWAEGGVLEALVAFLAKYGDLDPDRPSAAGPSSSSVGRAAVRCLASLLAGSPLETESPRRFIEAATLALNGIAWSGPLGLEPSDSKKGGLKLPTTSPKPKSARQGAHPSGAWVALAVSECLAHPPVAQLATQGEGLGTALAKALGSALGVVQSKPRISGTARALGGFSSLNDVDSPDGFPSPPGFILTPERNGPTSDKYRSTGDETVPRDLFPGSPLAARYGDPSTITDLRALSSTQASSSAAAVASFSQSLLSSSGRFHSGRPSEDRAMRRARMAAAQARPLPPPSSDAPAVRGSLVAPLSLAAIRAPSRAAGPQPSEVVRHVAGLAGEGLVAADLAAIIAIRHAEPRTSRDWPGITPKSTSRSGRASARAPLLIHPSTEVPESVLPELTEADHARTLLASALASLLSLLPSPPAFLPPLSDALATTLARGMGQQEAGLWSKEGAIKLDAPRCALDPRVRAPVLRLFCECRRVEERGKKAESLVTPRGDAPVLALKPGGQEVFNALLKRLRSALAASFPPAVSTPSFGPCVAALGCARDFLRCSGQSEAPEEALEALDGFLSRAKAWIEGQGRPGTWPYPVLRLMDAWLGVMEALCRKAASMALRNCLATYLVGCRPNRVLIREYARTIILTPGLLGLSKKCSADLPVMQTRALLFYRSLTRLLGTLPEGQGAEGGGPAPGSSVALMPLTTSRMVRSAALDPRHTARPGTAAALSAIDWASDESCLALSNASLRSLMQPGRCPLVGATWALSRMAFLVEPPAGLTLDILSPGLSESKSTPNSSAGGPPLPPHTPVSTPVKLAALALASELLSVPHSPHAFSRVVTDALVRASFVQFVRLYHSEGAEGEGGAWELCEAHLRVLTALASSRAGMDVRRRFYQLHVLEFLAREVGAEWAALSGPSGASRSPLSGDGGGEDLPGPPRIAIPLGNRLSMNAPANTPGAIPRLRLGFPGGSGAITNPGSADRFTPLAPLVPTPGAAAGASGRPRLPVPALKVPTEGLTSPPGGVRGVTPKSVKSGGRPPIPQLPLAPTPGSDVATPTSLKLAFGSQVTPSGLAPAGVSLSSAHSATPPTPLSSQPLDLENSEADDDSPRPANGEDTASEDWDVIMERMKKYGVEFTGDLEEDLDLLEELEEMERKGELRLPSKTSSPGPNAPAPSGGIPKLALDALGGRGKGSSAAPTLTDRDQAMSTATPTPRDRASVAELSPSSLGQAVGLPLGRAVPALNLGSPLEGAPAGPSSRRNQISDGSRAPSSRQAVQGGALSAWEKHFRAGDKAAMARGPQADEASDYSRSATATTRQTPVIASSARYEEERDKRPIYRDRELHLALVRLLLLLLLTTSGALDPLTTGQLPSERHIPNVLFLLHHHLNHPENAFLLPGLLQWAQSEEGPRGMAVLRLLRLLSRSFFRPSTYGDHVRIGRGAYAQVFRCGLPPMGHAPATTAVLKVMDLPSAPSDHCTQHDAFNEARILEELRSAVVPGARGPTQVPVTHLIDYGVAGEGIYVVLKDYKCSLRHWRRRHALGFEGASKGPLRLYLRVFLQCAEAVAALHAASCIHFDLKADNILLEPLPGVSEDEFWRPSTEELPFRVVLADFGESKLVRGEVTPSTMRNRGTECIKSPEMLLIAHAAQGGGGIGAGKAPASLGGSSMKRSSLSQSLPASLGASSSSDIWSLGCLLWEILTGDYLFADPDWIRFFLRVTQTAHPLLDRGNEAALKKLPGGAGPHIGSLLQDILQRDPTERPTATQVVQDVSALLGALEARHARPALRVDVSTPGAGASSADRESDTAEGSPRAFLRVPPRRELHDDDLAPLLLAPLSSQDSFGRGDGAQAHTLASQTLTLLPVQGPPVSTRLSLAADIVSRPVRVAPRLFLTTTTWLSAHVEDLTVRNVGQVVMLAPPHTAFGSRVHAEVQAVSDACRAAGVRFLLVSCRALGEEDSASKAALRSGPGNLIEALTRALRELRYVQGYDKPGHAAFTDDPLAPQALLAFAPGLSAEAVMVTMAHKSFRNRISIFEALRRVQLAVPSVRLRQDHIALVSLWQEELARKEAALRAMGGVTCRCKATRVALVGAGGGAGAGPSAAVLPSPTKPGKGSKLALGAGGNTTGVDCAGILSLLDSLNSTLDGEYEPGVSVIDPIKHGVLWANAREGDITVGLIDPIEEQVAAGGPTIECAPEWSLLRCGICKVPVYLVQSEGGGADHARPSLLMDGTRGKRPVRLMANFQLGNSMGS